MATYQKFNATIEQIFEGVHDFENDTLQVVLSNTAPATGNSALADLTPITAENGYTENGTATTVSSSAQTGGTYKLVVTDVVFTASGGSFGPLQYATLFNNSTTTPVDALVAFWDYGSSISINNGETFTVDFDATNGVIQAT